MGREGRWVGVDCGRIDLKGCHLLSLIVFLFPFPTTIKPQPSPTPSSFTFLTNCGGCRGAPIQFGIELGLQEGEKSDVASQCSDQSFSNPFALRIHPRSNRSERGQYHRLRDGAHHPIHVISNRKPSESKAHRRPMPMKRRLTKGTGHLFEKRRPRKC